MEVARMAYIVYYRGSNILKRLRRMPVNVAYRSKRMNYVVFYGDLNQERNYFNQVKNVRGFIKLEKSDAFNVDLNFGIEKQ